VKFPRTEGLTGRLESGQHLAGAKTEAAGIAQIRAKGAPELEDGRGGRGIGYLNGYRGLRKACLRG